MSEFSTADRALAAQGRSISLWAGVLGAPAIWAIQMQSGYALTLWTCKTQHQFVLHLITLVCLLLVAVCGFVSWRDWRAAGGGSPEETDGGPIPRTRFLGVLGIIVSAMFWLLILAQGIPSFFFDGCWT